MKTKIATLVVTLALFITTTPGFTHHADVAYQRTSIELKNATIVKVAWINCSGGTTIADLGVGWKRRLRALTQGCPGAKTR